jgi:hypothetical protein
VFAATKTTAPTNMSNAITFTGAAHLAASLRVSALVGSSATPFPSYRPTTTGNV